MIFRFRMFDNLQHFAERPDVNRSPGLAKIQKVFGGLEILKSSEK